MADHLTVLLAIWLLSIGTLAAAVWLANAITARELRDRYWREYNARRRGSNPPAPGRKPAPPAAPGMRREYLWSPSQMAECGGPCWEAQDPRCCDCGALWRDVPTTPQTPIKPQPTGPRMVGDSIKPQPIKPQFPPPRKIREDFS